VGVHDRVRDKRGRDLLAAEPTAVQAVDGLLGAVDSVELDVDFALAGREPTVTDSERRATYLRLALYLEILDLAVLLRALALDLLGELSVPVRLGLPKQIVVSDNVIGQADPRTLLG
jgi:hypothetical protein